MITPFFCLSQDSDFLTVLIRAPYCRLADAEIEYEDQTFLFNAKPYFLRLFLPAPVADDHPGNSTDYDCEKGMFILKLAKLNSGQHFPNLDMLSELIRPQKLSEKYYDCNSGVNACRPVEELLPEQDNKELSLSEKNETTKEAHHNESIQIEDEDLYARQALPTASDEQNFFYVQSTSVSLPSFSPHPSSTDSASIFTLPHQLGYGFGFIRYGVLGRFGKDIAGLVDITDPETIPLDHRIEALREFDATNFNEEHYLADTLDPGMLLAECLHFTLDQTTHLSLTDQDLADLKDMRARQLERFTPEDTRSIALSIVDLLFAFLYDLRTTDGEHNCESGWTISKLAPTLSFLVRWTNAQQAIVACVRRAICYPVFRCLDLAQKIILEDMNKILNSGRPAILHSLLSIRRIFNKSGEFRYLFNQLYINDLCIWIQSIDDRTIKELTNDFYSSSHQLFDKESHLSIRKCLVTGMEHGNENHDDGNVNDTPHKYGIDLDTLENEARIAMLQLDDDNIDSDDDNVLMFKRFMKIK